MLISRLLRGVGLGMLFTCHSTPFLVSSALILKKVRRFSLCGDFSPTCGFCATFVSAYLFLLQLWANRFKLTERYLCRHHVCSLTISGF